MRWVWAAIKLPFALIALAFLSIFALLSFPWFPKPGLKQTLLDLEEWVFSRTFYDSNR
jgi:hypothetical protein